MTLPPLLASLEDLARTNKARAVMTIKDFNAIVHALIATRDEGVRTRAEALLLLPLAHEWPTDRTPFNFILENMAEHVLLSKSYALLNFYEDHFGRRGVLNTLSPFGKQIILDMSADDAPWMRAFETAMGSSSLYNSLLSSHLGKPEWREAIASYPYADNNKQFYHDKGLSQTLIERIYTNRPYAFDFTNSHFFNTLSLEDIALLEDILKKNAYPKIPVSNADTFWAQILLIIADPDYDIQYHKKTMKSSFNQGKFTNIRQDDAYYQIMTEFLFSLEGYQILMQSFKTTKDLFDATPHQKSQWMKNVMLTLSKGSQEIKTAAFPKPAYTLTKVMNENNPEICNKSLKNAVSYIENAGIALQSRAVDLRDIPSFQLNTANIKSFLSRSRKTVKSLFLSKDIHSVCLMKLAVWNVLDEDIAALVMSKSTFNHETCLEISRAFNLFPTRAGMDLLLCKTISYKININDFILILNSDIALEDKIDILSQSLAQWQSFNPDLPYGYQKGIHESVVDSAILFDIKDDILRNMILAQYQDVFSTHPWTHQDYKFSLTKTRNISKKTKLYAGLFFLILHGGGINLDRDYPDISYKGFELKNKIAKLSSHQIFSALSSLADLEKTASMSSSQLDQILS